MSQNLKSNDHPLVSIDCTTYNHGKYVRNTIEGFLMQKITFPIEIIIHDDASTDNTVDIIKEYEKKYPELIIAIFQKENKYSKGIKISATYVWSIARGKYIAMCEGDDYWTDPYKLQKQVDFLEANSDFVICHHNMQVIYQDIKKKPHFFNRYDQNEITTIYDLARGNYINTASCVFKNGLIGKFPDWYFNCPTGAYPLYMLLSKFGKIRYMPKVMGVYRVHNGGVWEHKSIIYRFFKWADQINLMSTQFSPEINKILLENQMICLLEKHFKNTYAVLKFFGVKRSKKYLYRIVKYCINMLRKIHNWVF